MIEILHTGELNKFEERVGKELYLHIISCRHICIPVYDGYFIAFTYTDIREYAKKEDKVYFYCDKNDLVFYSENLKCRELFEKYADTEDHKHSLVRFLCHLTENDIDFLEEMESGIMRLEDALLTSKKSMKNAQAKIIQLRRRLLQLKRYYEQLNLVVGELTSGETDFYKGELCRKLKALEKHLTYLLDSVLHLREYVTQVREAYQAQIDIEQNYVMKIFTVITAIFLPLTLIVGWYGMNFNGMPELGWKFGYLYVTLLSVIVCLICIVIFKFKKWF